MSYLRYSVMLKTCKQLQMDWTVNDKFSKHNTDDTISESAMSTDSVLVAVTTDALWSSIGSSRTHETCSTISHGELSDGKSSTDASKLWCLSVHVSCDNSSSLPHCDVRRLRSLHTSSSGKLCRQLRMSSEKWKPSVTACLATTHINNNQSLSQYNTARSISQRESFSRGQQGHNLLQRAVAAVV